MLVNLPVPKSRFLLYRYLFLQFFKPAFRKQLFPIFFAKSFGLLVQRCSVIEYLALSHPNDAAF
jgi:hypothetical protein